MSTTFTLPMSAGDQFDHGHSRSHSQTKPQARHSRNSSRLAPPFNLPRIPSESISHLSFESQSALLDSSFRGHSHSHNHSASRSNGRVPTPRFDPDGAIASKKRNANTAIMASTSVPATSHRHTHRNVSLPTAFLLQSTENYSLLHGILADNDSRRIFYFMILNLAFMIVQSTYGILTGSLGLISDSIHMFFDCVALLVGVCAAVMSKWPPSLKFPYGYGKIDTLAGLGNGIFLMLISIEIIYEAIERLSSGTDISRTGELLAVSIAGFAVNLVGIFAFHGHHGHDHGHSHGHSHNHSHDHDHLPQLNHHKHDHKDSDASIATPATASPTKAKSVGILGHSHGNENMQGIYLHIMADALGSLSVVISTLLVRVTGWSGFDPLASCIIAVLIFASTIPLIISTTKILLLSLNSDIEYNLRDILSGVSAIKGVVGYAVPRFWLEDTKKESGHGHHHHDHSHGHDHDHDHHDHKHSSSDVSACDADEAVVLGVIHVIASHTADLADVRSRVRQHFKSRKMDIVVQMERESEGRCYCGGGLKSG